MQVQNSHFNHYKDPVRAQIAEFKVLVNHPEMVGSYEELVVANRAAEALLASLRLQRQALDAELHAHGLEYLPDVG